MEVAVLMQSRGAMIVTAVSLPVFSCLLVPRPAATQPARPCPVVAALFVASPGLPNLYVESLNGRFPALAIDRLAFDVWTTATAARLYGLVWGLVDRWWRPRRIVVLSSGRRPQRSAWATPSPGASNGWKRSQRTVRAVRSSAATLARPVRGVTRSGRWPGRTSPRTPCAG